jgi:hypothetical protein
MIQLPEAKAEELIQALSFKDSNPGFDVTIGDGGLVGSQNDAAIVATKILVKALAELAVPIVDQEPHINPFILGLSTLLIELRLALTASFFNSPTIRRTPQPKFSLARQMINSRSDLVSRGLPTFPIQQSSRCSRSQRR